MKIIIIIALIVIAILCVNIVNLSNALNMSQSNISEYSNIALSATNELNICKVQLNNKQLEIDKLNRYNDILSENITLLQNKIDELNIKLKGTTPYYSPNGTKLTMNNKDNTHNPTWNELKLFLENDKTDKIPYVYGKWVCGDYAQLLHNNAEKIGIRCGMAIINFKNVKQSHAINVFMTTDYGLVYIDDTGDMYNLDNDCRYDSIAYVVDGYGYGTLDIKYATSFNYQYFDAIYAKFERYIDLYRQYQYELDRYSNNTSNAITDYTSYKKHLDSITTELVSLKSELPNCMSNKIDVVKSIEIYW